MTSLAISLLLSTQPFDLTVRLNELLQREALRGAVVGVVVQRKGGEVLFSHNPGIRLVPASNQKIMTAAFALEVLGPSHRPLTKFWKEDGALFVQPSGDPSLSVESLQEVRKHLRLRPGTRVFVHHQWEPGHPGSWEWDDMPFRYAAPIHSFSVNRGAWVLEAEKGKILPVSPGLGVTVRHVAGEGPPLASYDFQARLVTVTGKLPEVKTRIGIFAQPNPTAFAVSILGRESSRQTPPLPARAPDWVIEGPEVRSLVAECLQPSDNIYAEHLLLMGAKARNPDLRTFVQARSELARFAESQWGLTLEDLRAVDGSGLSRHNLVTANGLARILRSVLDKPYQDDFLQAMPSPGRGTLSSRLPGVPVLAKTGTLNSVTSLSGYIRPSEADGLIFSVMMNNGVRPASQLREIQDEIVRILAQFSTSGTPSYGRRNSRETELVQVNLSNPGDSALGVYWLY